jgi:carboxyl-terminal processing protease
MWGSKRISVIGIGAAAVLALTACSGTPLSGLFNRRVAPTPIVADVTPRVQAQLRDFDFAAQSLRTQYFNPDAVGSGWQKVVDAEREQLTKSGDDQGEQFLASLAKIVTELKDEDVAVLPPSPPDSGTARQPYSGIGVLIGLPEEGKNRLLVLSVYPDSPADRAGLKAHDAIIAIEGDPVDFATRDDLIPKLLGEAGSKVNVTVRTPGQEPREVTLTRRLVEPNSPMLYKRLPETNIGYISPNPSSFGTIRTDTANALRQLNAERGVDGLVLDLRIIRSPDFPLEEMLSLFVNGQVGSIQSRGGKDKIEIVGKSIAGSQETPMAILVSDQTSGGVEAFAGLLQDLGRAQIVGTTTAGNLARITTLTLPSSQAQLRFPTGDYLGVKNNSWRGTGVTPNVTSEAAWEEFTADSDPQLRQAIDALMAK